jgi:hypothetical protein
MFSIRHLDARYFIEKIRNNFVCSDQKTLCNMPPDRPDASGIETDIELNSSQDYNFGENNYTMNDKEKENASVLADSNSPNDCQSEIPRWDKSMEKNNQSDDELTSLSWLHQQNLLKGLDISNPSKDIKHENMNMLNNNICDDIADFSENTNSVSSLDDSFCPGKTLLKSLRTWASNDLRIHINLILFFLIMLHQQRAMGKQV